MTLSVKLLAAITAEQSSDLDLGERQFPVAVRELIELVNGTGDDQADLIWTDQRTLAASASENHDLAGGLTDAFGTAMTFARIKGLFVKAAAANTNNVNVSSEATNGVPLFLALGDGIKIPPGGWNFWAAPDDGIVVTGATGDLLTVANSGAGTSVTYDIVIIGASA